VPASLGLQENSWYSLVLEAWVLPRAILRRYMLAWYSVSKRHLRNATDSSDEPACLHWEDGGRTQIFTRLHHVKFQRTFVFIVPPLKTTSFLLPPVSLAQISPQHPVLRHSSGSSSFDVRDKISQPNETGKYFQSMHLVVCLKRSFKWGSPHNNNVVWQSKPVTVLPGHCCPL
jgi:hypothetical protein